MYEKISEFILDSNVVQIILISKENLKDYCCLCSLKNLLDYEYYSLIDISDENYGFFLKINSKIIGEIIFHIKSGVATIFLFCIKEKYQKKQYGKLLLDQFISFCKKNNVNKIQLISNDDLSDIYYEKNGFIKIGDYYTLILN